MRRLLWVLALAVSICVVGFCGLVALSVISPTTSSVARAPAGTFNELELVSWRSYFLRDYAYIEGQVTNLTDHSLPGVTAVASWYTKDGTFITSDLALVEYQVLLPGQTSPFKTMTPRNPAMHRAEIAFRRPLGGTFKVYERGK